MALVGADELLGQQVKQKAVLPDAEAVAQVLPQDTDGPKASLAKARDRGLVLNLWVGHEAVKAVIVDQMRAQNPHGLDTSPRPCRAGSRKRSRPANRMIVSSSEYHWAKPMTCSSSTTV